MTALSVIGAVACVLVVAAVVGFAFIAALARHMAS